MNKKYIIFSYIFIISVGLLNSQDLNLKYYSDPRNGFSGVATAFFIDNVRDIISEHTDSEWGVMMNNYLDDNYGSRGRTVDRLTRNNQWLSRQALNEWDLEYGDVFVIYCGESRFAQTALVLITIIGEGEEIYRWWGRIISMADFE